MFTRKFQVITFASIIAGCIIPSVPYFSSEPSLFLDKNQYTAGEPIKLRVELAQPELTDTQLELFHIDQNFPVAERNLVNDTTLNFSGPDIPGHYEFRVVRDGEILTKQTFTMTSADIKPILSLKTNRIITRSQMSVSVDLKQQFQLPLTASLLSKGRTLQSWSITDETPILFEAPEQSGEYQFQLTNQAHSVIELLPFRTISPRQYPAISVERQVIENGLPIEASIALPDHITYGDLWLGLYTKPDRLGKTHRLSWKKASQETIQLASPTLAGEYTLTLIDRDANFIVDRTTITVPKNQMTAFRLNDHAVDKGESITLSTTQMTPQSLVVSIHSKGKKQTSQRYRWPSAKSPLTFTAPVIPGAYTVTVYDPNLKFRKIGELDLTVSEFQANAVLALNKSTYSTNEAMLATIRNLKPNGDLMWVEMVKNKKIHTIHYLAPQQANTVAMSIPAPDQEGTYTAYLVTNPNQTKRQLGIPLTVSNQQQQRYTLAIEEENHSGLIEVKYQHPKTILHRHWLGLYNTLTDQLISWQNLPSNKGVIRFIEPAEIGHYEVRLMSNQQAKLAHSVDLNNKQEPLKPSQYLSVLINLTPKSIQKSKVFMAKMGDNNALSHIQEITLSEAKIANNSHQSQSSVKFTSPKQPGDYVFWLEQPGEETPYLNSIYPFKLTSSQSLVYNPGMAQSSLTLDRQNLVVLYK